MFPPQRMDHNSVLDDHDLAEHSLLDRDSPTGELEAHDDNGQLNSDVVTNVEGKPEEDGDEDNVQQDQDELVLPEPIYPHMDIEDMLKIPSTILFPLELSRYLKDKLTAVVEENWHLTKHSKSQEIELCDLRKLRETSMDPETQMRKESPTVLSGKIIDLSKKNRDMTSQIEGMKVKIQQLYVENESLKKRISSTPPPSIIGSCDVISIDGSGTSRTGISDVSGVSQQLTKTTNKMMEYRKQNQILQMELRTALRALCQEVGEGTTVKTVLKEVAGPETTWRGRQQQIVVLNQKVSDLQLKLAQAQQNAVSLAQQQHDLNQSLADEDDDPSQGLHVFHIPNGSGDMGGSGDGIYRSSSNIPVLVNSSAKRQVSMLQNIEKKKHNQLDKLNQELVAVKNELKTSQAETKGSKARTQYLESQVRSLRIELDEAGIKVQSKKESLQQTFEELREVRQELLAVREREKKHRETSAAELHDVNQALAKERGIVGRLQKLIAEKQDHLQKLDSKVARLQDDMHAKSSASTGTAEYLEKIKTLENQLQLATQSIHTTEKERERLLTLISNSVGEAQQERQSHSEAERLLSRALAILSLTDSCINRCLDVGQVTSKHILEEVEEIRALVRELKAGTNCSMDFGDHSNLLMPQQSQSTPLMTFGTKCKNKFETNAGKEFDTPSKPKSRFLPAISSRQQQRKS